MPKTSSVSSARSQRFRTLTPHKQAREVIRPMASAPEGATKPAAGVMPTKPAIAPEQAPSKEGWPLLIHSPKAQATTPMAAANMVLKNASVAFSLADKAEPALKPNQPTHSRAAPIKVKGRL